jgi:hypothetical protein
MKPLPPMFALNCLEGDRWLVVSPSDWPAGRRTFERMEVRAGDCGPIDLQTRISKGADVSHRHAEISV